jgi:hypothetical protein
MKAVVVLLLVLVLCLGVVSQPVQGFQFSPGDSACDSCPVTSPDCAQPCSFTDKNQKTWTGSCCPSQEDGTDGDGNNIFSHWCCFDPQSDGPVAPVCTSTGLTCPNKSSSGNTNVELIVWGGAAGVVALFLLGGGFWYVRKRCRAKKYGLLEQEHGGGTYRVNHGQV